MVSRTYSVDFGTEIPSDPYGPGVIPSSHLFNTGIYDMNDAPTNSTPAIVHYVQLGHATGGSFHTLYIPTEIPWDATQAEIQAIVDALIPSVTFPAGTVLTVAGTPGDASNFTIEFGGVVAGTDFRDFLDPSGGNNLTGGSSPTVVTIQQQNGGSSFQPIHWYYPLLMESHGGLVGGVYGVDEHGAGQFSFTQGVGVGPFIQMCTPGALDVVFNNPVHVGVYVDGYSVFLQNGFFAFGYGVDHYALSIRVAATGATLATATGLYHTGLVTLHLEVDSTSNISASISGNGDPATINASGGHIGSGFQGFFQIRDPRFEVEQQRVVSASGYGEECFVASPNPCISDACVTIDPRGQPDLTPIAFNVVPSTVHSGQAVHISYTIKNVGTGLASATETNPWYDIILLIQENACGLPEEIGWELLLVHTRTVSLDKNETYTVEADVTLPDTTDIENFPTVFGANAIDQYTITGGPTGGTITFDDPSAPEADQTIAYNANQAAIQAAFDAMIGPGIAVVSGGAPSWTVEYLVHDEFNGLVPIASHTLSGGSSPGVTLTTAQLGVIDRLWRALLWTDADYNTDTGELTGTPGNDGWLGESDEDNNIVCKDIIVVTTPILPDLVPFSLFVIPTLGPATNAIIRYTQTGGATGGDFSSTYIPIAIPWNATQAEMEAILIGPAYSVGEIVITGDADDFTIEFTGDLAGLDIQDSGLVNNLTGGTSPDVTITQVQFGGGAPEALPIYNGDTISVRWAVENAGAGDATGSWQDVLTLSVDQDFHPATQGGSSPVLATVPNPVPLLSGESYPTGDWTGAWTPDDFHTPRLVTIPINTAEGDYFLVLKTDGNLAVAESDEGNNVIATAIHISTRAGNVQVALVGTF